MMQEENKRPAEEDALLAFEEVSAPQKESKKKRFSANTRLLIAVTAIVAVLAILLAVLLPLLNESTTDADEPTSSETVSTPEAVYPLYDHTDKNAKEPIVQAVTIQNTKDTYTVRYNATDKVYRLDGYADIDLAAAGVEGLTDVTTVLNGYDKVKTVEKLADFGLDKPSITVRIQYQDSSTATLLIGNETPDYMGYYARMQDSDEVVMIDADTVSYFQLKKGEYVERTLLSAPSVKEDDADGLAVLKEVTIKGGPAKETLTLRQAADSDGIEYSYSTFVITYPYMRMVSESISSSLNGFTYLIASEGAVLHPTAADKAKYGFSNPYAVLDVTLAVQTSPEDSESDSKQFVYYNEVQSKITVGSKDEDGNYYVMIDDHNVIYLVTAGSLSVLAERSYVNTISELLFLKDISDIKTVSITMGGKAYRFALAHNEKAEDSDKQMTVTCDGATLGTQDFRTLYSQMMGISRYGETDATPSGEPKYRIQLTQTDGKMYLSIAFYELSSSLYLVRTDEGERFTVKVSDVDLYMQQVQNYLGGKPIADIS